jgi:hypothetical protein
MGSKTDSGSKRGVQSRDISILYLAFIIGNLFLISLHYQLIKNYDIFYLLLFNFYY